MTKDRNAHDGHRRRLRERVMLEGLDSFNPHQVMEWLLFYAIPVKDVSDIAHGLIDQFGTLKGVLEAPVEKLITVKGVGRKTAEWLNSVGELVRAYCALQPGDRPEITNYQSAFKFCGAKSKAARAPSAYQLCLASGGRVQLYTRISESARWGDPGILRKCIEDALSVHARNMIIVVYTTDEVPEVTEYDCGCAAAYAYTLSVMGAALQDVLLVGTRETISLRRENAYHYDEIYRERRSYFSSRYLFEGDEESDYSDELPDTDYCL